jgi:hypothetical protein
LTLDEALAGRMAGIALGHVTREYPHKLDHVMASGDDVRGPRDLHPMFYGSFDWHSCVHGWWLLLRLLRLFPGHSMAEATRALAAETFTAKKAAVELAYLRDPLSRGFERPYGWAWLLALQNVADERIAEVLQPLAAAFAGRFKAYLPLMTYPIRTGAHGNTAFACVLAVEWARRHDAELLALIGARAVEWFGNDRDAQAWEPDGDAFLSPTLCEAVLMREVSGDFRGWIGGFLPGIEGERPQSLFVPAVVSDRSDGKIAHLDGLNLSRAWCWRRIAGGLAGDDPRRELVLRVAEAHLAAGLPHIAGDYAGEHWLATFALLALEDL